MHSDVPYFLAGVRFGLIANEQNGCKTPDSAIGFGIRRGAETMTVVGNYAHENLKPDNGGKDIEAIGYIMAR